MKRRAGYMKALRYSVISQLVLLIAYVTVIISQHGFSINFEQAVSLIFIVLVSAVTDVLLVREFQRSLNLNKEYSSISQAFKKKKAEQNIYAHLADISMDVSFEYDIKNDVMYLYGNFRDFVPSKVKDTIPHFSKFIIEEDVFYKAHIPYIIDAFNHFPEDKKINQVDCLIANAVNKYEWFTLTMVHHPYDNSKIIGFIRNIDKQVTMIEELRTKAQTDSLTGLLNKETTISYVNKELRDVSNENAGYFLLIDIDDFKQFNDIYGHLVGDHVIIECANLIKRNFQAQDIVGRIGGDEFVVFMKGITSRRMVDEHIVSLMKALENVNRESLGINDTHNITLSIGVFECVEPSTYDELCEKADKAMYNMKAEGKNSFAWYDENMTLPLIIEKHHEQKASISNIFYNLFNLKIENKTTKELLDYIATSFDINRISVYKVDSKDDSLVVVEQYCADGKTVGVPALTTLSDLPYNEEGLFYQNHYQDEINDPCTFMSLKIQRDDVLLGYITFRDNNPAYYWTNEEVKSIEILAYYICDDLYVDLKTEETENITKSVNEIISNLSNHTYVVDKDTHLLEFDGRLGKLNHEAKCYKHLYGLDKPCDNCVLNNYKEEKGLQFVHFETPNKKLLMAVLNEVEDEQKPLVSVSLNELPNNESTLLVDTQRKRFMGALYQKAVNILEMPFGTSQAKYYVYDNGEFLSLYEVNYDEKHNEVAAVVDAAQREEFKRVFNRQYLEKVLKEDGVHEVSLDYGRMYNGKHSYFRRVVTIAENELGEELIYSYITCIDELMKSTIASKGYVDALVKMYDDIYEVDLNTYAITRVYGDYALFMAGKEGRLSKETITDYMLSKVHPDDVESFIQLTDIKEFVLANSGNDDVNVEYRSRENDGEYRYRRLTIAFNRLDESKVTLYVKDIQQEKEHQKQGLELSHRSKRLERRIRTISKKNLGDFYLWNISEDILSYINKNGEVIDVKFEEFVAFIHKATPLQSDRDKISEFFSEAHIQELRESDNKEDVISIGILFKGEPRVSQFIVNFYRENEKDYVDVLILDISEKMRMQELKKQHDELVVREEMTERFGIIAEHTGTLVTEWRLGKGIVFCDDLVKERYAGDYSNGREVFRVWVEDGVIHPEDIRKFAGFSNLSPDNPHLEFTLRLKMKDGRYRYSKIGSTYIYENGTIVRALCTINDVDKEVKNEMDLKYRAEFDVLTGLFNYDSFRKCALNVLYTYPDKKYAMIQFDVNGFKLINEVYGREKGDLLLCHIADVLRRNMHSYDTYCRMNSDIFVMCVRYESKEDLENLIETINSQIERFPSPLKIICSFGIYLCEDKKLPIDNMVDWANIALKRVKGSYIHKYSYYDDILREKMVYEKQLEGEMNKALTDKEFKVYFQPKIDLASGLVEGAEALIRWQHPERGIISPGDFIPLFEKNGFIVELDNYICEEVCSILKTWKENGIRIVPVSVNVSRMNIYSEQFVERICEVTSRYGIDNSMIEFELTESVFLENPDELFKAMGQLRAKGFKLAMDDFGSGYSSLNMLRNVPIDVLKIDRAFFDEKTMSETGGIVVAATIELAHQLHIEVVAEGVETEEQHRFLREKHCDMAQGYLFSRPVPQSDFEAILKGKNAE